MRKSSACNLKRAAGVLLHITSLPSPFGIGDLGPAAFTFADFLQNNNQRYWQLLPLSVVDSTQGYSPYSSSSCMAGNTLLISPELLVKEHLLQRGALSEFKIANQGKVDFQKVGRAKRLLFDKAFNNFKKQKPNRLQKEFEKFSQQEAYWLDDFALYNVIKNDNDNKPWYEWPEALKQKDKVVLKRFSLEKQDELVKEKWLQFIFFKQWTNLKNYCNKKGICMFGDLPFYTSYDSVDVWSRPEIFKLDKTGMMQGIAGVPPDYFNADGQLWGMPIFRWNVLKENKYDWWIKRIKKNMELYDLLRFDHFRAFASYWEVAQGERTAVNGKWKKGPGSDFFKVLEEELGSMPFVAEDLGDIDESVHALRDEFHLPGMKVLQFAFSDDMAKSDHIPHNYTSNFIVYTGTHDNNTTRGWYREDADKSVKNNLNKYLGKAVSGKGVHIDLIRAAYASIAKIAIIPMQDVLGLDEKARINTPASLHNNWTWRVREKELYKVVGIKTLAILYNRS